MVITENQTDVSLPQELQMEVMAYLLRDRMVLTKFVNVLHEWHFDSPIYKLIYKTLVSYFKEFKRLPQQKTLERELNEKLQGATSFVPDNYFWSELNRLYNIKLGDRDYIVSKVHDFLVRKELLELAREAQVEAMSLEKANVQPVMSRFRRISSVLGGGGEGGQFLLKQADLLKFQQEWGERISTGFPSLDGALSGGWGESELVVILAPTGRGKSSLLVQFGLNALRIGKRVLHITLELSKDRVLHRYVASLTKIPKEKFSEEEDRIRRKLRSIRRVVSPADIHVKEWPSRQCSIDMLRGYIMEVALREGFSPDLIIVDYADLLKGDVYLSGGDGMYKVLGAVYESLRGLAMELQKPILTASQTNRAGLSKAVVSLVDVAESFEKVMVADVVIALCRTLRERQINEGRLFLAKNRDNVDEIVIPFKEDLSSSRIWEIRRSTIPLEELIEAGE